MRLLTLAALFRIVRSSRRIALRRLPPNTAVLDSVVTLQPLNGFGEGAAIHAPDQPDGINTLLAKTVLAGAEQPILFSVVSQRWIAIAVTMILGKQAPRRAIREIDTVEILRYDVDVGDKALQLVGWHRSRFRLPFHWRLDPTG